jgi:hypothetical protein
MKVACWTNVQLNEKTALKMLFFRQETPHQEIQTHYNILPGFTSGDKRPEKTKLWTGVSMYLFSLAQHAA